jgi:hypothetical protein
VQRRHSGWTRHRFPDGKGPADVFRERVLCCFIDDAVGVELLHHFNLDNVCWESDYPHSDTSWPNAPEVLAERLAGLDRSVVAKITHENAIRHFRFDPFARRPRESRGARRRHRHHGRPSRRRARSGDLAADDAGDRGAQGRLSYARRTAAPTPHDRRSDRGPDTQQG